MKKTKIIPLTEQEDYDWRKCTVLYLRKLTNKPFPMKLETDLMEPEVLYPMHALKGELLLKPNIYVEKAYYLKKGLVKLYYYNEEGQMVLLYYWDADSIVVLFRMFKQNLKNLTYYIQVAENSELVGISNKAMAVIYMEHPHAQELTDEILGRKQLRKEFQTEILQMTDKKRRYQRLKQLFPEFLVDGVWRLSNEEICSFINISETSLKEARLLYPDY